MSTSSNMVLIETKTVGAGGAANLEFTGIPQTGYTDLYLVYSVRSTQASTYDLMKVTFNGSSSGYSSRLLDGNGSSATSYTGPTSYLRLEVTGSTATSNTFGNASLYIPNYAGATNKSVSLDVVWENNATNGFQAIEAGLWSNTAAITSITLASANSVNIVEGSTASLYGIKSASKVLTPKATGGIISTSGNYVIHTFTASGTFTPTANLTNVEYLVIAGGGGASEVGGGAGGYRSSVTGESSGGGATAESKMSLTSGTGYTVTVGGGGASSTSQSVAGTNGSDSSFNGITSTGGGGGAARSNNGLTGGSGSGGGRIFYSGTTNGGAGTANQGYAGGGGTSGGGSINGAGGGGGGAGAVGVTGDATRSGAGGAGVQSSITGVATYRAGGGGACGFGGPNTNGVGGVGGGGTGKNDTIPATAGQPATGGGGGGTDGGSTIGSGGSGVVIIRYAA